MVLSAEQREENKKRTPTIEEKPIVIQLRIILNINTAVPPRVLYTVQVQYTVK